VEATQASMAARAACTQQKALLAHMVARAKSTQQIRVQLHARAAMVLKTSYWRRFAS